MRITDLSLTHYRGAESLHLKLDPNLNVFVGVNGSGKSTVLDAVAIMLSWAVNRIKSVGASGRSILETDIANDHSSALIDISCIDDGHSITWKLAKSRKGHGAPDTHSSFNSLNEFTKQIQSKIAEEQEDVDIPLFLYYPVNRAVLDIPLKIRKKHLFNLLNVYDESLTSGANFRTFFEWFREREDLENESRNGQSNLSELLMNFTILDDEINNHEKIKSMDAVPEYQRNLQYLYWKRSCETSMQEIFGNDSIIYKNFSAVASTPYINVDLLTQILLDAKDNIRSKISQLSHSHEGFYKDHQLEMVRNSLQKLLPEFTDFSIRRSPLRMEVKKNNKVMTINQLSDGEKCLIALVGDLARRMAIANPMRKNPLEGNGVVLIDEIDLHLHPKWQRTVVSKLTEVFPNCQFIISTHSPHVINHVQPENIFILKQTNEGIVATHPSKSYGNNVDRILEDLMGLETTRPDEVFQELRDIFSLIGSNSLSDAVEKIADLKQKIGTDPELVKAEVLLARKEIIGK
jgi:predicted ATP-binding protein involved in virulence